MAFQLSQSAIGSEPQEIKHPDAGTLVLIPSGSFLMGSPSTDTDAAEEERPQHQVAVESFWLGRTEVTYGQFRQFVSATGYATDAERDGVGGWGYSSQLRRWDRLRPIYNWRKTGFEQSADHPVVNVSWNDAIAYCRWLSNKDGSRRFRLPTEAEWEYACRAGTDTIFCWGNAPGLLTPRSNTADRSLYFSITEPKVRAKCSSGNDRYAFSAPVGSFKANPFGLYDMHGNVAEWCYDFFDEDQYIRGSATPPESGTRKVWRGGSFAHGAVTARSANRSAFGASDRWLNLGFRLACDEQ